MFSEPTEDYFGEYHEGGWSTGNVDLQKFADLVAKHTCEELAQQLRSKGDQMICRECETVAHCTNHGCIPKTVDVKEEIHVTPHTHAAAMMQYAEDAQTTDKPWGLWETRLDIFSTTSPNRTGNRSHASLRRRSEGRRFFESTSPSCVQGCFEAGVTAKNSEKEGV